MDGPNADQHRVAFERWRKADPAHARAYASLVETWQDTALISQTSLDEARSLSRARQPFHGWGGVRLAVAAACVVALGLSVAAYFHIELLVPMQPPAVYIATSVGVIRTQRLSDGSLVTLDTDSAITVDLSSALRLIRLTRGRARFDVAHDANRPFKVDAGDGEVVARGTLFDVDITRADLIVSLYRGAVDVRLTPRDGSRPVVRRLAPRQRFLQATTGFEPVVNATPAGEDRWTGGMLSFDSVTLADVASQANRYSNQHILVTPLASALKVTGTFRSGRSEDLARSLAAMFNLPLRRQADGNWELGAG
jgi:transmembrane sensor